MAKPTILDVDRTTVHRTSTLAVFALLAVGVHAAWSHARGFGCLRPVLLASHALFILWSVVEDLRHMPQRRQIDDGRYDEGSSLEFLGS